MDMEFALLGQQLIYYAKQAAAFFWYKLGLGLILVALAPHALALHGLALIFVLDFICGVWVAKRTRTLSSLGMRRGIAKLLIYFIFIGAVALAEHSVLQTTVCTLTAIGILSATEVLSIVENLVLLGLPIPYASKVLSMVSNKAANYGIKIDVDDASSMASARDVITMIEVTIPGIDNADLRICMEIFTSNWYQFMRSLDPSSFAGSHELMWERLRHALDRTMIEIRTQLMKDSGQVAVATQNVFLMDWAGSHLAAFYTAAKAASDLDGDPVLKIDSIRDALCLMLFRMVQLAQDRKTLSPKPQ
jgi:phage-related holin